MRFVLLHRNNEAKRTIAVNPLRIKQLVKHEDCTVIYYSDENPPMYDEVVEDFETVLAEINNSIND